jgi:hypothetical protein
MVLRAAHSFASGAKKARRHSLLSNHAEQKAERFGQPNLRRFGDGLCGAAAAGRHPAIGHRA